MLPTVDDPTYDIEFVAAVLATECPALKPERVRALACGWDCDVFVVNDRFVARFARNLMAARCLAVELEVLPRLAPRLPLPIPRPCASGVIPGMSDYRFVVYELLPGEVLLGRELSCAAFASLGRALGAFMRALHDEPLPTELGVAEDTIGRLSPARRSADVRAKLSLLGQRGAISPHERSRAERALAAAEGMTLSDARVLAHGDLHGGNLLLANAELCGVIDWVDVHCGHPAVDLAVAFAVLPPTARDALFEAYGPVSESTLAWARWRAIAHMTSGATGFFARAEAPTAHAFVDALRRALS